MFQRGRFGIGTFAAGHQGSQIQTPDPVSLTIRSNGSTFLGNIFGTGFAFWTFVEDRSFGDYVRDVRFLLVLVPAIGLIGYVVAHFWPCRCDSERETVQSLVSLHRSQNMIRDSDSDRNGFADFWVSDIQGIYYLSPRYSPSDPTGFAELTAAQSDFAPQSLGVYKSELSKVPQFHQHYWFCSLPIPGAVGGRHPDRFSVCAFPKKYGKRDRYTFIMDQSGVIWKKDVGGGPVASIPDKPLDQGWLKVNP